MMVKGVRLMIGVEVWWSEMNVELGCESKGNHDSGRWAPRKTRDGKLEI